MANNGNLKPFKPGDDARNNGRKGGIASGKARRDKREMQESARLILAMPLTDGEAADVEALSLARADGGNFTIEEASLIAAARKALEGDYKALEFLRDTAGEKPIDRHSLETPPDLEKAEADINRMIEEMEERHKREQETITRAMDGDPEAIAAYKAMQEDHKRLEGRSDER